ncbi:MAG TPA: prepilin-type N-terminal cleavage/methylation domain-containing protein [Patescibacteria group bacterium]|nr:prepilin-type N-terminal cleavage/methylation domain-containing protein [Patescibacteria group bacterium]
MIANALFLRKSKAKGFTPHLFRGWGSLNSQPNRKGAGFTLLELLIVITILAILAVIIIFVLNPAETLRKSRDVQRLSDLATLKNAISLYTTTVNPTILDGASSSNNLCVGGTGDDTFWVSYPYDSPGAEITDTIGAEFPASVGGPPHTAGSFMQLLAANVYKTGDGAGAGLGWIPVDLGKISGGSPISNMPVDPTNNPASGTSTLGVVTNDALMYRYSCKKTNTVYELNTKLESTAYTTDDNKASKDGGNNANLYEVGTDLTILPSTDTF